MRTDQYGQVFFSETEIFEALYAGKIIQFDNILVDNEKTADQYNQAIDTNYEKLHPLKYQNNIDLSVNEFDKLNQSQWFMPQEYCVDIEQFIYNQCQTTEQKERVSIELELFKKNNMLDLLKYLKYLVDTMRSNNIVWGVGRGSCVASYCLYLIGIHKIDSIKYDLPITEFFKSE